MSSSGAAIAAFAGRGNRLQDCEERDYEIILPTLPTGRVVLNTVFLHADVRARPYKVEDFRDAIANAGALPEVVALGAYQINHVWAVTFNSSEATKKFVTFKELQVKGHRCIIFDPEDQQVKLRLHWILHGVADEDIRSAFAAFGNVTEITRERWRVQGVKEKGSTTRTVLLKLKAGMKVDDLPHQVRVGGELGLVVVPGRPMQCLRCHGTGHVRRECKVPRCSKCRRYGHADTECVRTYASAAGLGTKDGAAEHRMDVVEAEEAAEGTREGGKQAGAVDSSGPPTGDASTCGDVGRDPETRGSSARTEATLGQQAKGAEAMTCEEHSDNSGVPMASASTPAKRPHTQTDTVDDKAAASAVEEPPAKNPQVRRPSHRPRPNVSSERRTGDNAHPLQGPGPPPDGPGVHDGV